MLISGAQFIAPELQYIKAIQTHAARGRGSMAMTGKNGIELLAAFFTLGGDVYPFGPTEISPIPFKDRVEAAAKVGYKGMGLIHADVQATAAQIGLKEMKRIIDDNDIKYLEYEFLSGWYLDGERRAKSDVMRTEMLEVAQRLESEISRLLPASEAISTRRPKRK